MHFRSLGGTNRVIGKGFILHELRHQLRRLHVDAMVTDEDLPVGRARHDCIEAYRRALRLPDFRRIINADINYEPDVPVIRNGVAESYFQPHLQNDNDLLLDPDRGIGERGREDVPAEVLAALLPIGSGRVLIVHLTASRDDSAWRLTLDQSKSWAEGRLQAFVYDLGDCGMLFLSIKGNDRLRFMRGALRCLAGQLEHSRVFSQ